METIPLAIKARLPFIHCKTDDLLYVKETLEYINGGKDVLPFVPPKEGEVTDWKFTGADVYYTVVDVANAALYFKLKDLKKTLVFVNTKKSVLMFDGGPLVPPKQAVLDFLEAETGSEKKANQLIHAFGGLNLKDCYDALRLTRERVLVGNVGTEIIAQDINHTRQSFMSRHRGIVQVDTDLAFYQPHLELTEWMDENVQFFLNPIHPTLTPRGLLFDGEPGTGKTAGGKYIAESMGLPLFRLDIGAMKGKYVGESEGSLNAALAYIDQMAPCVVLFDEIEKIFTETHDSGVTSSMLSSILWWLQEHRTKVFSVMTTNAKAKIPVELYREGRIDKAILFSGLTNLTQALSFGAEVFKSIAPQLPNGLPNFPMDKMAVVLKSMMHDGHPVAQGKVTQVVYSMVRKLILQGKENVK